MPGLCSFIVLVLSPLIVFTPSTAIQTICTTGLLTPLCLSDCIIHVVIVPGIARAYSTHTPLVELILRMTFPITRLIIMRRDVPA